MRCTLNVFYHQVSGPGRLTFFADPGVYILWHDVRHHGASCARPGFLVSFSCKVRNFEMRLGSCGTHVSLSTSHA